MPLSAMWRLRKIDPLTVDPAAIRIAARAPNWLGAPPGHVHFKMVSGEGEPDEASRVLDLVRADAPADLRGLAGERENGFQIAIFRANSADAGWLIEQQVRARIAKAAGEHHKGSFKFWAEPCRRAEPPEGPARVDLYLSLDDKEDFFKVYENIDLRDREMSPQGFDAAVPPCGKIARRAD